MFVRPSPGSGRLLYAPLVEKLGPKLVEMFAMRAITLIALIASCAGEE
jgi:hypothetical protein